MLRQFQEEIKKLKEQLAVSTHGKQACATNTASLNLLSS